MWCFAHLASSVGDQLMAVLEQHAETRIGEDLLDHSVHFNQFFFAMTHPPGNNLEAKTPGNTGNQDGQDSKDEGRIPRNCRYRTGQQRNDLMIAGQNYAPIRARMQTRALRRRAAGRSATQPVPRRQRILRRPQPAATVSR